MALVPFFNPHFFSKKCSKQKLCFWAAAKTIRLMMGWDPSLPDSAASQLTSQSKTAAASTLRRLSGSWLPNPMPRLPVVHRNLSQLSQGHQQKLLAIFLDSLPACPLSNPLSLTLFCIIQAQENKLLVFLCTTCLLLQASCSIREL